MDPPCVSIVIPVYNDPEGLQTTLRSLLSHTTYPNYDVVVVDNDSTDETPDVARRYADDHDDVSLVFERDVQSSYAARNAGIDHAEGDVLVFLDADQRVTDDWLTDAIDRLQATDASYLAPDVELDAGDDPGIIARYNQTSGFPIADFLERHHYAPTTCLVVTRDLLADVGTFDERLISGGDLEFGNRVHDAGYDQVYAPEVTVIHPTRNDARSLVTRNVRIGRGHCQLQRYYPDRYGRVGVPPRPSGIRDDQYDGSLDRTVYAAIALAMTAARGLGYYRECLAVARARLGHEATRLLGRLPD